MLSVLRLYNLWDVKQLVERELAEETKTLFSVTMSIRSTTQPALGSNWDKQWEVSDKPPELRHVLSADIGK
jgi:hypothetical protein